MLESCAAEKLLALPRSRRDAEDEGVPSARATVDAEDREQDEKKGEKEGEWKKMGLENRGEAKEELDREGEQDFHEESATLPSEERDEWPVGSTLLLRRE